MKNQVREIVEDCLTNITSDELSVLTELLRGFQKKQRKLNNSYVGGLLQMERTMTNEFCELTIPITPLLYNSFDIVHGGITATIIDTAMGVFANSLLPDGYGAVTTQLNIHYLAVGKGDFLQCKAHLDHKGTKTMVLSANVYRSDGKKIAHATGSFFIIWNK
ncbi:PaaI family thioesterase [Bacillus sp. DTU_2020_1000418_1_SI_GHA_SEK_038]|uniref:PaaI family thioesterase n=1 Tax=Bacillus sp. DTU_2020_1000418_1_SI_GHA_SEK_038 TaxID=3077585 RepID=UPI0028EC8B88|nr:PaaI family thioesterase [Bacillus sp. DTU_2020_1000418_1_SI_GHA_SEK_038]WNS77052.1 PaaI family thioesterase [Bacillus sp. DTU_2020_1000418_1_SI_GHA_SEK_038]